MPLTDIKIRGLKPDAVARKYSDAGGLHILVPPSGSKLWKLAYRFDGKQRTLSLGPYPAVKLAEARALASRAKEALAAGRDRASEGKAVLTAPTSDTFAAVALEWLAAQEKVWVRAHSLRVGSRLREDVIPIVGERPIEDITAPEILAVLRKIEDRGALDVAKRVRQSIGAIFRDGVATGRASRDPSADLKGALKPSPRVRHQKALKPTELPRFFHALRGYTGERQTALAIELTMRTMLRTNEIRFGRWEEIDGDLWRIPAERMKMSREHLVPLVPQTMRILKELRKIADGSEWIVPGVKGQPISQNTMIFGLYRMGFHGRDSGATMHGMRSLASTVLNESGLWTPDAIERQLAHVPGNGVRASYNHAVYLPERKLLIAWWNDWLDSKSKPDSDLSELLG